MVLNPSTGHVSPQFHVVFDYEFSTVPLMREGKIPPNWTDLVQRSSKIGSLDNSDLKDTWFTPDLEEDTSKNPRHEPSITQENNKQPQSEPHVQKSLVSK